MNGHTQRKRATVAAIALAAIVIASAFATANWFNRPKQQPPVYVGVEFAFAYDNTTSMAGFVDELKVLVDKVKDYTNLFVIGTPDISFNQSALNESCDYIVHAGLNFIVLLTDYTKYPADNDPWQWIAQAQQKYDDKFLGIYRFDEPGGNQLDEGRSMMVFQADNYTEAAANYTEAYAAHLAYWRKGAPIMTADYGLYWFDYQAGFDAVMTEFGLESHEIATALCRGAANAFGRDWGAIITWTYSQAPYIESGDAIYNDFIMAYAAGASYLVVFDYPKNESQYGVLKPEHFDALKRFWDYAAANPQRHGADLAQVAYVVPKDYAFGFRRVDDTIWGLWSADACSAKIWNDLNNTLLPKYGTLLDIVYDDSSLMGKINNSYGQLYFWNETIS